VEQLEDQVRDYEQKEHLRLILQEWEARRRSPEPPAKKNPT
jgi:hypothetical protein